MNFLKLLFIPMLFYTLNANAADKDYSSLLNSADPTGVNLDAAKSKLTDLKGGKTLSANLKKHPASVIVDIFTFKSDDENRSKFIKTSEELMTKREAQIAAAKTKIAGLEAKNAASKTKIETWHKGHLATVKKMDAAVMKLKVKLPTLTEDNMTELKKLTVETNAN